MNFSQDIVPENYRALLRPLQTAGFAALRPVAAAPVLRAPTLTRADDPTGLAASLTGAMRGRGQLRRSVFGAFDAVVRG
jgi:hypothetical protein